MDTAYRTGTGTASAGRGNTGSDVLHAGSILTSPETGLSYRIRGILNRGGFGVVYDAQRADNGLHVAIKELFPGGLVSRGIDGSVICMGDDSQFRAMQASFLKEAEVLKQLSHIKSVVRIYDYFHTNQTAYYVMEFVSGSSLKDYIQKHGPLSFREFQPQIQRLMQDIEEFHHYGVIHRDITPDNIMLTADSQFKLVDFGSARKQDCQRLTVHIKRNFAPLEQYSEEGKQGAFTDVYSLAATIYYCCTGRVVTDALSRYGGKTVPSIREYGADLTAEQVRALAKALEIKPENRFQTMQEFEQSLFPRTYKPELPNAPLRTEPSKLLQQLLISWEYLKQEPLFPVLGGLFFLSGLAFQLLL